MNDQKTKEIAAEISTQLREFVWCAVEESEKLTADIAEGNDEGSGEYWRRRGVTDRACEELVEVLFVVIFEEMQRRIGG